MSKAQTIRAALLGLEQLPRVELELAYVDRLVAYLGSVAGNPVVLTLADAEENGTEAWYCSPVAPQNLYDVLTGQVPLNDVILSPGSVWIDASPTKVDVRPLVSADCDSSDLPAGGARLQIDSHTAARTVAQFQRLQPNQFALVVRLLQNSLDIGLGELAKLTSSLDVLLRRAYKHIAEHRYGAQVDKKTRQDTPSLVLTTQAVPQSSYVLCVLAEVGGSVSRSVFGDASLFTDSTINLLRQLEKDHAALEKSEQYVQASFEQMRKFVNTILARDADVEFYGIQGTSTGVGSVAIDLRLTREQATRLATALLQARNPNSVLATVSLDGNFRAFGELEGANYVFQPDESSRGAHPQKLKGKISAELAEEFHDCVMGFRARAVFRTEKFANGNTEYSLEAFRALGSNSSMGFPTGSGKA